MFLCATIPMTDLKVLHLEADPYEDKTKQNKTKSQSRVQAPSRELLALCLGVLAVQFGVRYLERTDGVDVLAWLLSS